MRLAAPFIAGIAVAALAVAPAVAKTTVSLGMQQEPTVLDPTVDATAAINVMLANQVYESLATQAQTGEIIPQLAASWTVSEDGLNYVFTLREGVTFHDGAPMTADTVRFSFERAKAEGSENPRRVWFEAIESIETPDPLTVEITLKAADSFFLWSLAQGPASIVHPDSVENNVTAPVGTGPWKYDSWTRGDRLTLARNEDHRDFDPGQIERLEFRFIADPSSAVAALLSGDLDAYPGMPAPETLAQFEADPRFTVAVGTTNGEVILALNHSKPPFDDLRVRRAISHALDRQEIIDGAYYGYGEPIGTFFPPHDPAYVDLTSAYPLDHDAAKALLAEAGHPDGLAVSLRLPPFPYARRSGEIIQSQLAKIGVTANIENVEWAFWIGEVFREKNYDMTIIAHTEANDLGNFARGPDYYWGYDNPEFNALWDAIRAEADPARRDALLQDAQRMVTEDAVHGFLFQLPALGVYRTELSGYWTSSPTLHSPRHEMRWTN